MHRPTRKPSPYYFSPRQMAPIRDGFRWLTALAVVSLAASILLRVVLMVQTLQGVSVESESVHVAWSAWLMVWDVAITIALMSLIAGLWYTLEVYLWP